MNNSSGLNIASLFIKSAEKYPDKIAVAGKDKTARFGDLAEAVKQAAAYYRSKGIGKGDRVLVFVPMSTDLYRITLALFYCGATVVFLDEWVSVKRLEACCEIADCKAFIGGWKVHLLAIFSKELRKIPTKLGLSSKTSRFMNEPAATEADDTALITFTTGSTGRPKAAKRTHGYLMEQFKALTEVLDPSPEDVDITSLPIVLLLNLGIGCTSVIGDFKAAKPWKFRPDNIIRLMEEYRINRMTVSPFFLRKLSEYVLTNHIDTGQLKKIFTGGAAVFPSEAMLFCKAFPGTDTHIVYGSTEAEPISLISAATLADADEQEYLPVGVHYRNTSVRIIPVTDEAVLVGSGEDFDRIILKQGEVGEIIVAGPHVLKEYFNSEEAFRQNKIIFGNEVWHRTGDAGRLDAEGKLELAGRCSQIIQHKGQLIYPFLFEKFCTSLEGVQAGAVLKIQDRLIAAIELKKKTEAASVKRRVLDSGFPVDEVIFIKTLPRDPRHFSKTDYAILAILLEKQSG
jgi:acyl-CoA synthetase (AMP-forming)/AMP-acid ligase II